MSLDEERNGPGRIEKIKGEEGAVNVRRKINGLCEKGNGKWEM